MADTARFTTIIDGVEAVVERIDTEVELAYVIMEGHEARMGDYVVSTPGKGEDEPASYRCYTPEALAVLRRAR